MSASRRSPRVDHLEGDGVATDPSETTNGSANQSTGRAARLATPRSPSEQLERLTATSPAAREVVELGRVVYTQAGFDRFLSTPMAVFDGRTALELLEDDQVEPVLAALAADYEGLGY